MEILTHLGNQAFIINHSNKEQHFMIKFFSPGVQTGFGFSQGQNGQTQATAQLGGNIQTPQLGGINFGAQNRPGSFGGVQPTFLNRPFLNFFGK